MRRHLLLIVSLVLLVVLSLSLPGCSAKPTSGVTPIPSPSATSEAISPNQTPQSQEPALPSIREVVAKVKPSVVAINVEAVTYDIFGRPAKQQGAGSGWIIDKDGYIVTNNHVVEGAQSVTVTLGDGRVFSAQTVRTDPLTDLAVVKVDAQDLPALAIGDSSNLAIGDWVVAVGNALGMGISATDGIVSALNVSLSPSAGQTLQGLIQTNAAINPGNSGGPLVNMAGEVIGINSIKIAEVGVEGMGYAISINEAMPIIKELISTGYVVRPWLGAELFTVDRMIARWYRLAVDSGVLVTEVAPGGPAEKSGLRAGDVITAIGSQQIGDASALNQVVNSYKIGQTVEVTYWRGETKSTAQVALAESPPP